LLSQLLGIDLHLSFPTAETRLGHLLIRLETLADKFVGFGYQPSIDIGVDALRDRIPEELLRV
jgi:hypothetical protein